MKKYLWSFALTAVALAACGKKEEAPAAAPAAAPVASAPAAPVNTEEKVLNIYNWPDYVPEGMIAAFEKESGIKVNYDTFETNEALQAKLVAGNTGYDIVVPGTVFAKGQIEGGLLQPLDKSKIKNLANLDPAIMATLTKADPENKHLVPWAWGFTTVGINKTKVTKALGSLPMPENAWDLVFDPKYSSKLKSCGIAYLDSPTEIMPVALHYVGKDAYSNNPEDYKLASAMLAKVRKDVRLFSSTMIDDIAGGKACVAVGWSGDINIAAGRAKENGSKDEIESLLPSTGALIFFDTMAITKDAKHPNNAAAFIDFYLRAENAALMSNEMSYPTGNKAAIEKIKPEIAGNKTIFVESDYFAKMIPPSSFSNEAREALATAYNAFKKGK
ncbi:MAG: spermidine/putrescine ABC transporter substrate-binding protein PotF [Curvibacter sp. RIFCSPHIGHO2_12_FULL_63_18]|uniref:extracellular solute-binding protein n=1 Tax=Rhodoferax sp. TaxID=50421 RepID=UPI0008BDC275|nr:extracellular solute-binding protein [Rhodoferax sp.]OGO94505.1 MAG: spermidine/putrescine ABC transporter substrate-binding protein PotF [Curvibacter sp. GWA2_63_95]OGP01215.1 MAG: spermidine/putrescine ABC transporter substrate-binding protein PotF [Curvibacter sp. RIFCSPHIGHO2_12_FULL_63_18]HCX83198.1 spermidine/putrescine ABC transporter substrate-binding protein PotF [Rhodoferax sp.]